MTSADFWKKIARLGHAQIWSKWPKIEVFSTFLKNASLIFSDFLQEVRRDGGPSNGVCGHLPKILVFPQCHQKLPKNCRFGRFSGLTCPIWLSFGLKLSNNYSCKVLKDFHTNSILRVLAGSKGHIKITFLAVSWVRLVWFG